MSGGPFSWMRHILLHRECSLVPYFAQMLDDGTSNDGAVGEVCHFFCLLRGRNPKAYGTGDIRGSFHQLYHGSDIGGDGTSDTRYTERRDCSRQSRKTSFAIMADPVLGGGSDAGR